MANMNFRKNYHDAWKLSKKMFVASATYNNNHQCEFTDPDCNLEVHKTLKSSQWAFLHICIKKKSQRGPQRNYLSNAIY